MKLSCAFSIVVLFVTGLNIPLVTSSTSSSATSSTQATSANTTAANTSTTTTAAANTSTTTTAANTTAASTATTTTSQTTTAIKLVCIEHTCNASGCLTNANSTGSCNGSLFCTMVQRVNLNQTSYNITAGCANSCTQKDEVVGGFTERTRCCQSMKCNKDDAQIVALTTENGGSTSNQTPLWILSIMLFISAFEI